MYHFRVLKDSDVIFKIIYYLDFFCRPAFKIKTKTLVFWARLFSAFTQKKGQDTYSTGSAIQNV